jgi:nitroreductase
LSDNIHNPHPAPATHSLHELLAARYSPRAIADRPVEQDKILSLLEAARWAPSSYNEQPWSFIIATQDNPEAHDKLTACLVDANRAWAAHAPVILIAVGAKQFSRNGKPNRHYAHDTGMALMSIALQATALGLISHMMAGFDGQKAKLTYKIPETHEAITAMASGYPGDVADLPAELQSIEGARDRKTLNAFIFGDTFGQTASLLG